MPALSGIYQTPQSLWQAQGPCVFTKAVPSPLFARDISFVASRSFIDTV
jgi:hypothetical protein